MDEKRGEIINLWVKRQERERERDENQQIWVCRCGWRFYEILRGKGPCCERCGRLADVPY